MARDPDKSSRNFFGAVLQLRPALAAAAETDIAPRPSVAATRNSAANPVSTSRRFRPHIEYWNVNYGEYPPPQRHHSFDAEAGQQVRGVFRGCVPICAVSPSRHPSRPLRHREDAAMLSVPSAAGDYAADVGCDAHASQPSGCNADSQLCYRPAAITGTGAIGTGLQRDTAPAAITEYMCRSGSG